MLFLCDMDDFMNYEISSGNYAGPIEKLLELVEAKKMEVTEIALSLVTEDFIQYYRSLEESTKDADISRDLKTLCADFLVVASRLVFIKSRSLIPELKLSEEEESDINELQLRVEIYKEIRQMKQRFMDVWSVSPLMLGREFLMAREPIFYPSSTLTVDNILNAVCLVESECEKFLVPEKDIARTVISLKDKMSVVLERITHTPYFLGTFFGECSRRERVVFFLAVLHLVRTEDVNAEQDGEFSDIQIARCKIEV
jgi:segregation and condensation protein A